MAILWNETVIESLPAARRVFLELKGKRWLCRGQQRRFGTLFPTIDRNELRSVPRYQKLALERNSIDTFRSSARYFADPGEAASLSDDVVAIMLLRHFCVPTRLLDWTLSPWVAAFFATNADESEDGELWTFDEPLYELLGREQWVKWPETTSDGSGDPNKWDGVRLTAFEIDEPPDWIISGFYYPGFHRQNAQQGAYTMTARLGRDHAERLAELLPDPQSRHVYVIPAGLKPSLLEELRQKHGISRGSLFPDSAGAAETAHEVFRKGV